MDIHAQKLELMQLLMNTQEPSVLDRVRDVFVSSTDIPVAFDLQGNPLNKKSYVKNLDTVRSEVRKGDTVSLEDLEKESENW